MIKLIPNKNIKSLTKTQRHKMPNRITFILERKLIHNNIMIRNKMQNTKYEKEKFHFISTEFDYLLVCCYYSCVHIEGE